MASTSEEFELGYSNSTPSFYQQQHHHNHHHHHHQQQQQQQHESDYSYGQTKQYNGTSSTHTPIVYKSVDNKRETRTRARRKRRTRKRKNSSALFHIATNKYDKPPDDDYETQQEQITYFHDNICNCDLEHHDCYNQGSQINNKNLLLSEHMSSSELKRNINHDRDVQRRKSTFRGEQTERINEITKAKPSPKKHPTRSAQPHPRSHHQPNGSHHHGHHGHHDQDHQDLHDHQDHQDHQDNNQLVEAKSGNSNGQLHKQHSSESGHTDDSNAGLANTNGKSLNHNHKLRLHLQHGQHHDHDAQVNNNDLIRISSSHHEAIDLISDNSTALSSVISDKHLVNNGQNKRTDSSGMEAVNHLFIDDDQLYQGESAHRSPRQHSALFVETDNYKRSPFGLKHQLSLPGVASGSPLDTHGHQLAPYRHHQHHHQLRNLSEPLEVKSIGTASLACKLAPATSSNHSNESMHSTSYLVPVNNRKNTNTAHNSNNNLNKTLKTTKTAPATSQTSSTSNSFQHHLHHQQQVQTASSVVLVKFCSIVYAMFLIILGCILHISELKKKTQNSIDHIYSSLVAIVGMLWLAFLHVDLQRYKRYASRFLLLDSIVDLNNDLGSTDRMSLNTEVIFKRSAQLQSRYTTATPMSNNMNFSRSPNYHHNQHSSPSSTQLNHLIGSSQHCIPSLYNQYHLDIGATTNATTGTPIHNFVPAYKFLRGKIGAGFYLKCGMAAFCFGHVVHEGLHFGQQVYFLVNDNGRCQDIPALVAHLITPLYSFYQLFIMFKYSNLVINRYKGFAYFGLMHVIGTSIAFWFRTIIEEAFDDFITKMDYFKQHHSLAYNDRHHKASPFYTNATNNIIPNTRLLTGDHYQTTGNNPANLNGAGHNGAGGTNGIGGPTNNNNGVTTFDNVGDDDLNSSSSTNGSSYPSYFAQQDRNASNISQNIIALMSPHLSVIAPQLAATLPESYACSQNSLLTTKSMNALPYLYPFTIEYNLLIAATFLELYFNVGKMSTNAYNNPYRREIKQNYDGREELEYKSNFVVSADCHAANRGLFCGFFTLMVTLVSIVIFFVSINKPGHIELGIKINLIQETTLITLILVVATLGFMQTSRLNRNPCIRDQITTNDALMLIPLPFFFTHSLLSVKAEYGTITTPLREVSMFKWIAIVINLISVIEVLLQTSFIIDGLRRCSQTRFLRFKKPGRELLTFCIILNLTLWIVSTFESKSVEQYHVEIEYYGPLSWMLVSHTTLPVMLFYRYHSSVCLAEIWGRAYKAAKSY